MNHYSETHARRRKHLSSLFKREGFVREETRYLGGQRVSETWSRVSLDMKETMTFNKFDHEHRDIIRDLVRGIRSEKLKGTDTLLYTDRSTFLYKITHNFRSPPEAAVPAMWGG
jgi:hypothetical protein